MPKLTGSTAIAKNNGSYLEFRKKLRLQSGPLGRKGECTVFCQGQRKPF
ncbi:hypothetical protein H6G45_13260 [Synechocystis sp. FACHB-383]|nr:hypothetical protein [Synechocystis sp. FACHB-383]MBD2654432.1 hypothetical protein [Synechocystis sp. FACHB-383]